jgi:hypothetical protein
MLARSETPSSIFFQLEPRISVNETAAFDQTTSPSWRWWDRHRHHSRHHLETWFGSTVYPIRATYRVKAGLDLSHKFEVNLIGQEVNIKILSGLIFACRTSYGEGRQTEKRSLEQDSTGGHRSRVKEDA